VPREHQRTRECHTDHTPQSDVTGLIGQFYGLPGVLEMVLGTVTEAYAGVTRVEGCQRTDVSGTTRQGLSFAEDDRGLFLRDAQDPKEAQHLHMRGERQRNRLLRIGHRGEELPHALPVPQCSVPVVRPCPLSCSSVPARGVERLARLFEMMSNQRSTLIQFIGVETLQDAGNRGMQADTSVTELRVIRHLLREWMLEGILGLWIERRFVQKVHRDQRSERRRVRLR
jgi:hypothetical protein